MTVEIAVVLAVLVTAVVLFATEKLSVDLVALLVMATLLVTGIVTPDEGIAGFSNTATVTVGAMFVLSAALFKTGAVDVAGALLRRVGGRSLTLTLVTMMLTIGTISAFINNTAAVAIFLPVVIGMSRDLGVSPSKLLMPLSFASMFGGVCTLIGTSTNILVSSIAERHGQPPFSMFEFAPVGLVMFAVGTVYMLTVGIRLVPDRHADEELTKSFDMRDYLTDIVLQAEAKSVGSSLAGAPLTHDLDLDVLEIRRGETVLAIPDSTTVLEAGDMLRVRCRVDQIRRLEQREGIVLKAGRQWRDSDLESGDLALVEAVVAPRSPLDGKSLEESQFRNLHDATVLAIRHRGEVVHEALSKVALRAGDVLLLEARRENLERLRRQQAFIILTEVSQPELRRHKMLVALCIIAAVIAAAAMNLLPMVVAAVAGCVLLVLTGCLRIGEVYEAIEWKIIFLLAGVLTLGTALETSGAALYISRLMVAWVGDLGPVALVAAFYLLTTLMTETMSNNAAAALLAPIAISSAEALGVDARPLLMAVTFAASASFMTPVGYQTNTLIYGPGRYRFFDFVKVGTPLNVLFWLLATLLIPWYWPL